MKNYVVGKLMGRCGNQFYQIATTIAYAKKHNLDYFVTNNAQNCDNDAYYFNQFPKRDLTRITYEEKRDSKDFAIYEEIPKMDDAMLVGYWQSFDYFNEYREEILNLFNLPYQKLDGFVSLHIRRGDYLQLAEKLSVLPIEYYRLSIEHFTKIGKFKFLVFSDDIEWCKSVFNDFIFPEAEFEFSEGRTELEDLSLMSSCEHNICANSTFSYAGSWFNRNENKIVLTPDENNMFGGCNLNMIPKEYVKIKF